MANIWVLAADGGRARIFEAASPRASLTEIKTLSNAEARLDSKDIATDRPGRTFDSAGEGRHAMTVETDPKEHEEIRFAKQVAEQLEQGRVEHAFDKLVLVAAPRFLGRLRTEIDAPLAETVALEIDKDYTTLKADELRERLPEQL